MTIIDLVESSQESSQGNMMWQLMDSKHIIGEPKLVTIQIHVPHTAVEQTHAGFFFFHLHRTIPYDMMDEHYLFLGFCITKSPGIDLVP